MGSLIYNIIILFGVLFIVLLFYVASYFVFVDRGDTNPLGYKWGYVQYYPIYSVNNNLENFFCCIFYPMHELDKKIRANYWLELHPEWLPILKYNLNKSAQQVDAPEPASPAR